jgi:hypothetical protein
VFLYNIVHGHGTHEITLIVIIAVHIVHLFGGLLLCKTNIFCCARAWGTLHRASCVLLHLSRRKRKHIVYYWGVREVRHFDPSVYFIYQSSWFTSKEFRIRGISCNFFLRKIFVWDYEIYPYFLFRSTENKCAANLYFVCLLNSAESSICSMVIKLLKWDCFVFRSYSSNTPLYFR